MVSSYSYVCPNKNLWNKKMDFHKTRYECQATFVVLISYHQQYQHGSHMTWDGSDTNTS